MLTLVCAVDATLIEAMPTLLQREFMIAALTWASPLVSRQIRRSALIASSPSSTRHGWYPPGQFGKAPLLPPTISLISSIWPFPFLSTTRMPLLFWNQQCARQNRCWFASNIGAAVLTAVG